jgi:hypothetical protein
MLLTQPPCHEVTVKVLRSEGDEEEFIVRNGRGVILGMIAKAHGPKFLEGEGKPYVLSCKVAGFLEDDGLWLKDLLSKESDTEVSYASDAE